MPVHNQEIADKLGRLADLLEIRGENEFRVRAYRTAAQTVGTLPRDAHEMLADDESLSELPGIGEDLAGKIATIVQTGELPLLNEIEEETAAELSELMKIPGLGPKRVSAIHDALGVETVEDLQAAAEDHQIRKLEGFGAKTEEKILDELDHYAESEQRTPIWDVDEIARGLVRYLGATDGVKEVVVAGSYRRRKETVGDLDILVTCEKRPGVMERFLDYDEVDTVVSQGKTRSTVVLRTRLQIDLRVVEEAAYGAALFYFTGSRSHNIAVRKIAQRKGLKINEYGVFRGDRRVAGKTEQEVFEQVDLPFIPPELRENRGEIDAAQRGTLPELVRAEQIRGNLHTHTDATDGKFSLAEMAEKAQQLGWDYLAITDHSKAVAMANGLNEQRLRQQMEEIAKLNERLNGFRVLRGIEVDILENGTLDLEEDALNELDIVVGSVHDKFDLGKDRQTERVIRAMDHRCFNILAHPTGRLINRRRGYEIDIDRVLDAALERGCALELNAQPKRLDLNDAHCQLAKEKGVKIAISTDAHSKTDLEFMRFGVDQARRGWLEADDVLNTRNWDDLKKFLRRDSLP